MDDKEDFDSEYIFHHRSGRPIYVSLSAHSIYEGEENIGRVVIFTDITKQKEMEEVAGEAFHRLQANEKLFADVINNTPAVIFIKDLQGRYIKVNRRFEVLFKVTSDGIKGKTDLDLFPQEIAEEFQANDRMVSESCEPLECEERVLLDDGIHNYISIKFPLIQPSGEMYAVCGIATDITDRKKTEDALKASSQDKEVLLRELHHRVKNNLQIISSLLQLQSSDLKKKKASKFAAINALLESRSRVIAMSMIHESLYRSKELAQIKVVDYVRDLVGGLCKAFGAAQQGIQCDLAVDEVKLGIDKAILCGLIINELVANSLGHAFPNGRTGTITITVKALPDAMVAVSVGDNGVGIPEHFDLERTDSLGLTLVHRLTRQLDGTITVNITDGTAFHLIFKGS